VGYRGNITGGICRKPSGDGFEGPSLTDFRNRLSKLDPLMGPMASAYQAHIEADHCESALLTDQQKEQFLIKVGFVGLPLPGAGLCPSEV